MNEKKKLDENINSLHNKINFINSNHKKDVSDKIVKEKIEKFLNAEYINQEILFDIVDRIEIDENKKIYIRFNFEQLNMYNLEEIENACL